MNNFSLYIDNNLMYIYLNKKTLFFQKLIREYLSNLVQYYFIV